MNKLFTLVTLLLLSFNAIAQDQNLETTYGVKAGINNSTYLSNSNSSDFAYGIGFFAGGLININLDNKIKFQPELLFSLNRFKNQQEVSILDINGDPLPNTSPYGFNYQINEYTLVIPLAIHLYLTDDLFLESGPQFTFILDRTISSSEQLLDGTGEGIFNDDFNNFDLGIALGAGYNMSSHIVLSFRTTIGLIERDKKIKTLVFNLGLGYLF